MYTFNNTTEVHALEKGTTLKSLEILVCGMENVYVQLCVYTHIIAYVDYGDTP